MIFDKKYIVDDNNKKLAVQLSIETLRKIEEALENYALYQLMNEDKSEVLSVAEAREYYQNLENEVSVQ